jgi:hypothetical protein
LKAEPVLIAGWRRGAGLPTRTYAFVRPDLASTGVELLLEQAASESEGESIPEFVHVIASTSLLYLK